MGRIIRGQVVASTRLDKHCERLDEGILERLFEQLGPDMPLGVQHDVSQTPAVKFLGKHLVRLEDGELAITVDLEVLDEEALAETGGFSISFTNLTHRYGVGEPTIRILVNPLQFDFSEACTVVTECHPADCYDVTELVQKAELLATAVIVVVFVGTAVAAGFLNAAGADLYQALRKLRRKDQPRGPTAIQFHLDVRVGSGESRLILVVPPDVPPSALQRISEPSLAQIVHGLPDDPPPDRIVVTVLPDGRLHFDRSIDADG